MNTYEPFSAHQIPLVALPDAGKGLGSLLPMHSGYECLGWSPRDDKLTKNAPPKKAKATSFHIINKKAETYLTQKFIFAFLRAPVRQRARRFCWCLSTLQIHWSTGGDCAWVLKPGADNIWQHVSDFFNDSPIHCNPMCVYIYVYIYCIYMHIIYIHIHMYFNCSSQRFWSIFRKHQRCGCGGSSKLVEPMSWSGERIWRHASLAILRAISAVSSCRTSFYDRMMWVTHGILGFIQHLQTIADNR